MGSGYSVKVQMNNEKQIEKRLNIQDDGPAVRFLRDDVYRLYEPYVPRADGNLYRQVGYPNNHTIKHNAPYSHYHYKGKKAKGPSRPKGIKRTISNEDMKYQGAPKRGPELEKRMMNDRGKEVERDLENFIKNGGK